MTYDLTLKDLFQQIPYQLVQTLTGCQVQEALNVEYPAVKVRRPDLVARLTDNRLYHLELQSHNDSTMIWRMLEYYTLIYQNYQQMPFQQVLYVGQAPLNMTAQLQQNVLYYQYQLIDIREIDCRSLLESVSIADNLLAILCQLGQNENQVVKEILSRVAHLEGKKRQDALEQLRIIAGLRSPILQDLVKQESIKMPITVDMSQTIWGIELFEQGEQKGRLAGKAEGKAEGEREGKLKGEAAILQRLLERCFGPLPAWAVERIQQADCEQLEVWSLRVLEVGDLESIFV